MKDTQIHEIIAIEDGLKSAATKAEADALRLFLKETSVFDGLRKEYSAKTDEDEQKAGESRPVVETVMGRLGVLFDAERDALNATATKEYGNTLAKADIVVDGKVLAADVPVSMLVQLENRFRTLRSVLASIPVLDPIQSWELDEKAGILKTQERKVQATKKIMVPVELAPATDKHPAQVKESWVDIVAGTWTTQLLSGRISEADKNLILKRMDNLLMEIKMARQRANTQAVVKQTYVSDLINYIL